MVYSLHAVRLFCYVLISCCVDIWEGPPAEYVRAVFRHACSPPRQTALGWFGVQG